MSFHFRYLLFLLLCVSPHACNSRYIGLYNKETKNEVRFNGKDFLEQGEVREIAEEIVIVPNLMRRSIIEERKSEETKSAEAVNIAISIKENSKEESMNKEAYYKDSSSLEVLQEKTEIKGRKMKARSTMESENQDDTDENIKSQENGDTLEDVVVMDYAQPHRKPPIHNLEP